MKNKIIGWENWSQIEKELTDDFPELEELASEEEEGLITSDFLMGPILQEMRPQVIQTPFGNVSYDSKFKPSDRWDCWLGHTNFNITEDILSKMKEIEGVDVLRILSRYSFCIGIGKMFNFSQVRKDIENAICKR